jgi:hypothetical protein
LRRLKYQYCGFLIAERLRRDIKAIGLRYEERRARTGSGLDLADQIVVVEMLLLVDIYPGDASGVPYQRPPVM